MQAHFKIRTEKTGHYYTHGTLGASTRFAWVVLHGYGQQAAQFIRKFDGLDPARHFVVAPEGLNRFYFEGLNERPVSTWMTRQDRLDEIADYVLFLEQVRAKVGWEKQAGIQVILLGFSQGVSTLVRWMHNARPRVDHLVLWAGGWPEDMDIASSRAYFNDIPCTYFLGRQDQYISIEKVRARLESQWPMDRKPELLLFEGDHRVSRRELHAWVRALEEQNPSSGER